MSLEVFHDKEKEMSKAVKKNYLAEFVRYVLLNVASMIGLSVYILADTYFISKGMGADGLTALNLALPVYNFIYGIGMMAGIGGAVRFTYYLINKDQKRADSIFMNSVWFSLFFSVLFFALGQTQAGNLAVLLGADETVYEMTRTYLRVILTFSPAFIGNNMLSAYVRNDGEPGLAMTGMLLGSFFNIVFDYIFIFPLNLGIFGAALATGFSPVVGILTLSTHFQRRRNHFHFRLYPPKMRMIRYIVTLGFAPFLDQAAQGVLMIVFNLVILRLAGNIGVAAYGVIANIYLVIVAIFNGIAQGAQPIMSELYAKDSRKRLRSVLWYGVVTVAIASALIYFVTYGFTDAIVAAFNSEGSQTLAEMASHGLWLNFAGVVIAGLNILMAMYFVSVNKGIPSQLISLARGILLILPMVFLLSSILGIDGVWLSMPVTEVIVAVCVGIYLYRTNRGRD